MHCANFCGEKNIIPLASVLFEFNLFGLDIFSTLSTTFGFSNLGNC